MSTEADPRPIVYVTKPESLLDALERMQTHQAAKEPQRRWALIDAVGAVIWRDMTRDSATKLAEETSYFPGGFLVFPDLGFETSRAVPRHLVRLYLNDAHTWN